MAYNTPEKAKEYARNWRKRNPDKVRAYAIGWKKRHPDKAEAARIQSNSGRKARKLFERYGITPEQKEEILLRQNNCCAICNDQLVKCTVDHDHKTGVVRGILCYSCNVGLGLFKDSKINLVAAIHYLDSAGN